MKKIFIVILTVCMILCGCSSVEQKDNSSIMENKNIEIKYQNQINDMGCPYLCETQDYYYYLNVYNNYTLCRYDKKTGEKKNIFNDNIGKFLHSVRVYKNNLFFVTRTQNDEIPALYKSDLDGNNAVKLLNNVGDYYFLKEDAIYYASYVEENGDIFYIYKFDIKTGKNILLVNRESVSLNMIGDIIYYVDITFDIAANYSTGAVKALDTVSGKTTSIELPSEISYVSQLRYYNNKLYIKCLKAGKNGAIIASVNLVTNEFSEVLYIGEEWNISNYILPSEDEIYCLYYTSNNENGLSDQIYSIVRKKGENHSTYEEITIPQYGGQMGLFENKLIIFDMSKDDDAKIHGADKLNVRISEA